MLWHVAETNLYLMGSIHVLDVPTPPLNAEIKRVYSAAKRIVFEARLDQQPDISSAIFADGDCLSRNISAQLFSDTQKLWLTLGLPEAELERIRPWFAALRLAMTLLAREGFTINQGVDKYFWERAIKDQLLIANLESMSASLTAFASTSNDDQERFLAMTVERKDAVVSKTASMVRGWKENRIEPMIEVLNSHFELFPQLYTKLLYERNEQWMAKLLEFAQDDIPTLAMVGALHFTGSRSLQILFQNHGFVVSQVD
jgi:uncharacterized protein YbaP (TraB family)